jgi:hypothetical protein
LSCELSEIVGTTCQPAPVNETGSALVPLPWSEILSALVGKSYGAGKAGMLVDPLMAKRCAIGLAKQLCRRQPRPNACCNEASSE